MIYSITFEGNEKYEQSPKDELYSWSKSVDRSDVISICVNADGSITAFYWG